MYCSLIIPTSYHYLTSYQLPPSLSYLYLIMPVLSAQGSCSGKGRRICFGSEAPAACCSESKLSCAPMAARIAPGSTHYVGHLPRSTRASALCSNTHHLLCTLRGTMLELWVFSLYNDTAAERPGCPCRCVCRSSDRRAGLYVKLSKAYYAFLEYCSCNHLDVLSGTDSSVFIQLVKIEP
jgi:hypothetical protein